MTQTHPVAFVDSAAGAPGRYPAWLGQQPDRGDGGTAAKGSAALHALREHVASRWFALRQAMRTVGKSQEEAPETDRKAPPALALFSVAGGSGKSTLAAALARALSAQGERVLLVDLTPQDLLPCFFGGGPTKGKAHRTFSPPGNVEGSVVHLWKASPQSWKQSSGAGESDSESGTGAHPDRLFEGLSRLVLDLPSGSEEALRCATRGIADLLVPLTPDLHAVLSLRPLREMLSRTEYKGRLHFLLVQFDPSQPLHLDVREHLEQELGGDLLPLTIRRSSLVADALAQGMTPLDFAPGDGIARDLGQLAQWVRTFPKHVEPAPEEARWSER